MLHGWINILKPSGVTSSGVVNKLRKMMQYQQKVGHAGTLDPLAYGVLPLALGEANKMMPYCIGAEKEYEFIVQWGQERSTDDAEGVITSTSLLRPELNDILQVMPEFIGDIQQVPPVFSAIKICGKRAYDMARRGVDVILPSRTVKVYSFNLLSVNEKNNDAARFSVKCGQGFYIRSLARDLGRRLGCFAFVKDLCRVRVGDFLLSNAVQLDRINNNNLDADNILPIGYAAQGLLHISVTPNTINKIRCGQEVNTQEFKDGKYLVSASYEKYPAAVCEIFSGKMKAIRVFVY